MRGDEVLGDLNEDYAERSRRVGRGKVLLACLLYLLDALAFCCTHSFTFRSRAARLGSGRVRRSSLMVSWSGLLLDLRSALRSLLRRPLLSAVAIASLAIGLGANTAIFSLINVLFLRPLPGIAEQERLVEIGRTREGSGFDSLNYLDFEDLKRQSTTLDEWALWSTGDFSLATEGGGRRLAGLYVTPSYFRALGVRAERGRLLHERAGDDLGERGTAVLSHRIWKSRFGGDEGIVGREIRLNRRPFTVVGVTDPAFHGHVVGVEVALYVSLSNSPEIASEPRYLNDRRAMAWSALGRLAPGHSAAQADAEIRTLARNLAESYPASNARRGERAIPLGPVPGAGRGPAGGFTAMLMALVMLLLCATCANVAGILTAKALSRARELGTRRMLGCGRARLARLLLFEALLLTLVGGALGLGLAVVGLRALDFRHLPVPVEFRLDLTPDLRVFGFCFTLSLVSALLLGLPAALSAGGRPYGHTLVAGGWRGSGLGTRWRRVFVGVQVAGASVLVLAAALFLRTLERASAIQTGFDPKDVLVTGLDLSLEGYSDPETALQLLDSVQARIEALPGATRAAVASDLPLDMGARGTGVVPEPWDGDSEHSYFGVDFNQVSPGYFETLQIPLLTGRGFEPSDRGASERVAVVSRTFAERWPAGPDAVLGARFRYGRRDGPWTRVVGVVEDTKNQMLMDQAKPFVYLPLAQNYEPDVSLVVRGSGEKLDRQLRAAVLAVDPSLSLSPVVSLAQITGLGTLPQRMAAILGSALGAFAVLLAGLGIYGVIALQVTQRAREIGLRMALGEERRAVLRRIVAGAFRLVLPGLIVGALLGLGFARLLRGLLLGLSPLDPFAMGTVAIAVTSLVLLASLVPARRAARVDPAQALRSE